MKITVYTTKDCEFSKQEKEYLKTNSLQYEEKDLEANKDFLTEMMTVSNNFAGTPVTKIEKDDGTISILKGFTKEEFDTTLGIGALPGAAPLKDPTVAPPTMDAGPAVSAPAMPPVADSTMPPAVTMDDKVAPTMPTVTEPTPTPADPVVPAMPPMSAPPVASVPEVKTDELNSVLDKLQEQTGQVTPPPATVADVNNPVGTATPTIPDFPGK